MNTFIKASPFQNCCRLNSTTPGATATARLHCVLIISLCFGLLDTPSAGAEEVEAVSSKVSKDYVRKKLPDGSYKSETYTFGKGDNCGGARVDPTFDKLDFMDVARILAVPLAKKGYIPTRDQTTTNELIMVYWGTTRAPEHATESNSHDLEQKATIMEQQGLLMLKHAASRSEIHIAKEYLAEADNQLLATNVSVQAENQRREDTDMKTATLLGYDSWWTEINGAMGGTAFGYRKQDMLNELEEDRYFVVLAAFDYQSLVKQKKSKFLWEVRFSVREYSNAFDKRIEGMAELASITSGTTAAASSTTRCPRERSRLARSGRLASCLRNEMGAIAVPHGTGNSCEFNGQSTQNPLGH
jgi:hypothetical protein